MEKKISELNYDNFIINGEVDEQLPLYTDNLNNVYPLTNKYESLFPTCEIRENKIIYGSSDMLKRISNVSIENNTMKFNGNSEIELDKELLKTLDFQFEIKFKLNDISSDAILLNCKSLSGSTYTDELTLKVDYKSRSIYASIPNLSPIMSTPTEFDDVYMITDSGAINKDIWYTLKFTKENQIISVYLNDILVRALICVGDFKCDYISVGKGFKGHIEYIKTNKSTLDNTKDIYSITNKCLLDNFTVCHYWRPDPVGVYDILKIGNITIASSNNSVIVKSGSTNLGTARVIEGDTYYIAMAYDINLQQASIYIYNESKHELLFEKNAPATINTDTISVINNESVFNLLVYNSFLEKRFVIRNVNKKFSINNNGDIRYDIDEYDTLFKHLGVNVKINLSKNKSGELLADDIISLMNTEDAVEVTEDWNKNLHHKTYRLPNWSTGYNSGVDSANVGYHAKWVREFSYPQSTCLKFINCNKDFGHNNRWLGSGRVIPVEEIWNRSNTGDKIRIVFRAKADKPCNIQIGIYRYQKSTSSYGFGSNKVTIKIKDNCWQEYSYETTIDSDWDITKEARLYFYGNFTEGATSFIKDIYLIRNGNDVDTTAIKNDTDKEILLNLSSHMTSTSSIMYKTKILNLTDNRHLSSIGNMSWGIVDDKLRLIIGNVSNAVTIPVEDILNEWITVYVYNNGLKAKVMIGTSRGIFKVEIDNQAALTNYNLTLGSSNKQIYGSALFKDLTILKSIITEDIFEKYHRTKISYYKNKIVSNVDICESIL